MARKNLDLEFEAAFKAASETNRKLPADVLLKLYAYYKHATKRNMPPDYSRVAENDLRSAFKYNALAQIQGMSSKEAKMAYIKLVERHIH
ncbi:MAG: acyl-CoA-binding protein [Leeuwenhoekiella sp.]